MGHFSFTDSTKHSPTMLLKTRIAPLFSSYKPPFQDTLLHTFCCCW